MAEDRSERGDSGDRPAGGQRREAWNGNWSCLERVDSGRMVLGRNLVRSY